MKGRFPAWFILFPLVALQFGITQVVLRQIDVSIGFGSNEAMAVAAAVGASVCLGTAAALTIWWLRPQEFALTANLAPLVFVPALSGFMPWGYISIGCAIGTACALWGLNRVERTALRAAACCGVAPLPAFLRVVVRPTLPQVLAGTVLSALVAAGMVVSPRVHSFTLGYVSTAQAAAVGGGAALVMSVIGKALVLLRRPRQ